MNPWLSISFLHNDPNFSLFKTIKNQLLGFDFYFIQEYIPFPHLTYIVHCEEQKVIELLSKNIKIIREPESNDASSPAILLREKKNSPLYWGGEKGMFLFYEQQKENSLLITSLLEENNTIVSSWNLREAIHIHLIHFATCQLGKYFREHFFEQFPRTYFQLAFDGKQQYEVLVKEYEKHFQSQKESLLHNAAIILEAIEQDEPDYDFFYMNYLLYMKRYSRVIQQLNTEIGSAHLQVTYNLYDALCHLCNNRLQIDLRDEAMVIYFVKRILEELNFEEPIYKNTLYR